MAKVEKPSPSVRLPKAFKELATVSEELAAASDQLSRAISSIESELQAIPIGVSAWHTISSSSDDRSGDYWSRAIGYTQYEHKYHICLKRIYGNEFADQPQDEEVWKFAEAPRWMCVEAIDRIPDLLDELIDRSKKTTSDIQKKVLEANELLLVFQALAAEYRTTKKQVTK